MSALTRTAPSRETDGTATGGRIISRPLALVFLSEFCALTSFDLLLSVTPKYAAAGVPEVIALPVGLWLAGHYGYAVVVGMTAP